MRRCMTELNMDKFCGDKLDFGQFGSILGLHWDAFAALFSLTGPGFQDKGCQRQNPLFMRIILKVSVCI